MQFQRNFDIVVAYHSNDRRNLKFFKLFLSGGHTANESIQYPSRQIEIGDGENEILVEVTNRAHTDENNTYSKMEAAIAKSDPDSVRDEAIVGGE